MADKNKYFDGELYSDGEFFFPEQDCCRHCREKCEKEKKSYKWADLRYSFGYYAGRYCDECWKHSGFRDANDEDAEFDESFAGESLHGEDDGGGYYPGYDEEY